MKKRKYATIGDWSDPDNSYPTDNEHVQLVGAEFVAARLEEAAETLRQIPFPKNGRPSRLRSALPEYKQEYWELMNSMTVLERDAWERDHNKTRLSPSPAAVGRMDECLNWIYALQTPMYRKVVWATASGAGLRRVGSVVGMSHEWVRTAVKRAHSEIAGRLAANDYNWHPATDREKVVIKQSKKNYEYHTIYLITVKDFKTTKIGIAQNASRRFAEIQGCTPIELILYKYWWMAGREATSRVEGVLKKKFEDKNVRGEWFDLAPDEMEQSIISEASRIGAWICTEQEIAGRILGLTKTGR